MEGCRIGTATFKYFTLLVSSSAWVGGASAAKTKHVRPMKPATRLNRVFMRRENGSWNCFLHMLQLILNPARSKLGDAVIAKMVRCLRGIVGTALKATF